MPPPEPAPLGATVPLPAVEPIPPLPALVDSGTPGGSHREMEKAAPAPPSPPPMALPPAPPVRVAVTVQPVVGAVKFWPLSGVRANVPVGSAALPGGPGVGVGVAEEEAPGVKVGLGVAVREGVLENVPGEMLGVGLGVGGTQDESRTLAA